MAEMITKVMIDHGCKEWSWALVYGYLTEGVRNYLKGNASRDRLTAEFAMLELERSVYFEARDQGMRPLEALHHTCGHAERRAAGTTPLAAGPGGRSPGC